MRLRFNRRTTERWRLWACEYLDAHCSFVFASVTRGGAVQTAFEHPKGRNFRRNRQISNRTARIFASKPIGRHWKVFWRAGEFAFVGTIFGTVRWKLANQNGEKVAKYESHKSGNHLQTNYRRRQHDLGRGFQHGIQTRYRNIPSLTTISDICHDKLYPTPLNCPNFGWNCLSY